MFSTTFRADAAETAFGRVSRHVRHLQSLAALIRRVRPAVVHIHTCSGYSFHRSTADLILTEFAGLRTILHVHGAKFHEFYEGAGLVQRRLISWPLGRADRVVVLSEKWRDELSRIAPAAQVRVIQNAVPIPQKSCRRGHEGRCRFLLLARMDLWKGIDDLLDAAARMHAAGGEPDVTLAGPTGSAGGARTLEEKIRQRHLEGMVRYVGTMRGGSKIELLRQSDVYVQPSHHEGMPIAILEALSYGLPVIATAVGAVPEVITDQCEGIVVAPHDPLQLCQAMQTLAADPAKREKMGDAAYQTAVGRFGLARLRDDLVSLYDGILAPANEPTRTAVAPRRHALPGLSP
jgi:glycosyltransferase involved in cell wall biosynthesis